MLFNNVIFLDSSWQSKFGYALLQERFVKFTLENHHILV